MTYVDLLCQDTGQTQPKSRPRKIGVSGELAITDVRQISTEWVSEWVSEYKDSYRHSTMFACQMAQVSFIEI